MLTLIPQLLILCVCSLAIAPELHAKAAEPKAAAKHGAEEAKAPAADSAGYAITDKYTHNWVKMPALSGLAVDRSGRQQYSPSLGTVLVVVFIASWCLPCQQVMPDLIRLEKDFRDSHTRFVYVFTHDTFSDAAGFAKAYKLGSNTIIADTKALQDFHQPELPSVFLGDRNMWLTMRLQSPDSAALQRLEDYLSVHTAF